MRSKRNRRRWGWSLTRRDPDCIGSVAAEFALVAPTLILIAAGVADFGMLTSNSTTLTATTHIGAEYARLHPADTEGIQNAMQSSMSFTPALSFPASFLRSCECDDRTSIA
jgi:Flp pilus assembly protein TadG